LALAEEEVFLTEDFLVEVFLTEALAELLAVGFWVDVLAFSF